MRFHRQFPGQSDARAAQAVTIVKFRLLTTADYVTRIVPSPPPQDRPRGLSGICTKIYAREFYVIRDIATRISPWNRTRYNGIYSPEFTGGQCFRNNVFLNNALYVVLTTYRGECLPTLISTKYKYI